MSATYYRQTARNLIQLVLVEVDPTTGTLVTQNQNAARVRNTGLELQASARLGRLGRVTANYAFTSSKVLELAPGYFGELLPGDRVLELPEHTAGLAIGFTPLEGTSISSGVTYVGERTNYDYLALFSGVAPRDAWITYDPFAKMNLSVTQALTSTISALLTIDNVTNNNAGEQFDILPSLGRVTTVGVRARR
jgi:outer membrane receptor protein involved in Fe transport